MKKKPVKKSAPKKAAKAATITLPLLNEGERWVGIVSTGTQLHHVILLPGEFSGDWDSAVAWAKEQGGELPSRLEQSLLWAEARDQFKKDWYWSGEQCASYAAWGQSFYGGGQFYGRKSSDDRARAIRRAIDFAIDVAMTAE